MKITVTTVDQTTSTSDLARQAIDRKAPAGAAFQAGLQTHGKGRHGRCWNSPRGNLYLSLVLRPERPPQEWGSLSLMSALALAETLESYLEPHRITLKWPNDVLVDGCKIAGILLEGYKDAVIVGFGVNVVSAPDGVDTRATCLRVARGADTPLESIRDRLIKVMAAFFEKWSESGLGSFRDVWMERSAFLNEAIAVQMNDGGEGLLKGVFRGINADGSMRLEKEDGEVISLTAGDIMRARAADAGGELAAPGAEDTLAGELSARE